MGVSLHIRCIIPSPKLKPKSLESPRACCFRVPYVEKERIVHVGDSHANYKQNPAFFPATTNKSKD